MKIIIIGGGFCGSTLSLYLDQDTTIDTILIDKKPYFEYTPSLPKLLNNNISQKEIQPHLNTHLPYQNYLTTIFPKKKYSHIITNFLNMLNHYKKKL
jgi:NADH dehydrogenase FAD-containing subunit